MSCSSKKQGHRVSEALKAGKRSAVAFCVVGQRSRQGGEQNVDRNERKQYEAEENYH
jgi:hypothetical protein